MPDIKKILVSTDFSEHSQKAVRYAAELAGQLDAELHILHVFPLLMYAIGPDAVPDDPNFENRIRAQLQLKLDATLKELGDTVNAKTHMADGNPGKEIPHYAAESGVDLVVMGTHGRSGFDHMMLGSVAEKTVRTSKVPVLTIR